MLFGWLNSLRGKKVRTYRKPARLARRARLQVESLEERACPSTGPIITLNPVDMTVALGQRVSFTAHAIGTPTPVVQWEVSNDGGHTFSPIRFANSTTYSFVASTQNISGDEFEAIFYNAAGGKATTTAATLTVDVPPHITTQPTSQTVAVGSSVTLTAAASGSPAATVQWQVSTNGGKTFSNLTGQTSPTLTVTAPAIPGTVEYRAVFSNAVGTATTRAAIVTGDVPPVITIPVTTLPVNAGLTATLTVGASGTPAPKVQWQQSTDGGLTFHNIPGATGLTLKIAATVALNGSEYRAVLSNPVGQVISQPATLIVDFAPVVTTQPKNQTVAVGSSVTLTAAATSNPGATVQWQVSIDGGKTFTNVVNATGPTLQVTAPLAAGVVEYRAVFTDSVGQATSRAAILTVDVPPAASTDPSDTAVNAGLSATFTVGISGTPLPKVQWQRSTDGGLTFQNIAGATGTTLKVAATAALDGSDYRALLTNPVGQAYSHAAKLTVHFTPVVTTQPQRQTVAAGTAFRLTAGASGNPADTVQWQVSTNGGKTFSNIQAQTSPTLTVTAPVTPGTVEYRAVFTNTVGSATSQAAIVTVDAPPVVTTDPADTTVLAGQTVTFTAGSNATPTAALQWQVSTDGGVTFQNITGATSPTLSFTATPAANGYQYRAVFTNPVGQVATHVATLTVQFAPTIITQPASQTVIPGTSVTLTAAANGSPAVSVQWQVSTDGGKTFSNIQGQTSPTLTVSAPLSAGTLEYRAVFTNSLGSVTSQVAIVTVDVPPAITTDPVDVTVHPGQTVTFTAAASGTPTATVQWQESTDGGVTFQDIAGATSPTLSFPAALTESGFQFRAVFSNPVGQVISAVATLTVN
jgi:hypothetical protein